MHESPGARGRQAGFSLIELLVVIALIASMAIWIIPSFLGTLHRTRLVGAARELAVQMQVARLEAVKRGSVNGNPGNEVVALLYDQAGGSRMLRVMVDDNPDGLWLPETQVGGVYTLPKGVFMQAPGETTPEGTESIRGWDDASLPADEQFKGPVFRSDGSAVRAGAFRLHDGRGNYLEVQIEFPATGKPSMQKWFGGSPADWWENGEANHKWQWY